jgi:hypothetical protein
VAPDPPHNSRGDFCLEEKLLSAGICPQTFFLLECLLSPDLLCDCKDEVFPLETIMDKAAKKTAN